MNSTLHKAMPRAPGGSTSHLGERNAHGNGTVHRPASDSGSDGMNGDIPPEVEMTVFLPDDRSYRFNVDSK